jgi:protein tyrosine/serine phosphatase
MQPAISDRRLDVTGLVNIRDLGGLRTAAGRCVRRGQVFRSDSLVGLTDEGADALLNAHGVRLVIDLRTPQECAREGRGPLAQHDVGYLNLPLEPQAALNEAEAAAGKATNLLDDYLAHLRLSGDRIVNAFRALAQPGTLPALVHCTAGKDRTGIVTALLLDLLDVEREAVVEDYAATGPAMAVVLERIRASEFFRANGLAGAPTWIFEARPETMRAFLATVDEEYGGTPSWARARGLADEDLEALRAALVE